MDNLNNKISIVFRNILRWIVQRLEYIRTSLPIWWRKFLLFIETTKDTASSKRDEIRRSPKQFSFEHFIKNLQKGFYNFKRKAEDSIRKIREFTKFVVSTIKSIIRDLYVILKSILSDPMMIVIAGIFCYILWLATSDCTFMDYFREDRFDMLKCGEE